MGLWDMCINTGCHLLYFNKTWFCWFNIICLTVQSVYVLISGVSEVNRGLIDADKEGILRSKIQDLTDISHSIIKI